MRTKLYKIFAFLVITFIGLSTFTASAANITKDTKIYFDLSAYPELIAQAANGHKVQLMVGHSSYSQGYVMTKVSGTDNVYYVKMPKWDGCTEFAFFTAKDAWGSENTKMSNRLGWTSAHTSTISISTNLSGSVSFYGNPLVRTDDCVLPFSYVLMGVKGDWTTGVLMVRNTENTTNEECKLVKQLISKATDAVKVVKVDANGKKIEYFEQVKISTIVPFNFDDDKNIVLEDGRYDFYFDLKEKKTHIEGDVTKEVKVYLDPKIDDNNNWDSADARMAVYYFDSKDDTRNGWVNATKCGDIYYAQFPVSYDSYIWCRMNPAYNTNHWNETGKERVYNQTNDIKLDPINVLTKVTDWNNASRQIPYGGTCGEEYAVKLRVYEAMQYPTSWYLQADVVDNGGLTEIDGSGFYISKSTEKNSCYVTDEIYDIDFEMGSRLLGGFSADIEDELEPGYWYAYRAYIKANGEVYLSSNTCWFYYSTCNYKDVFAQDTIYVEINQFEESDPCNFKFKSFEEAWETLKYNANICVNETKVYGELLEDEITLVKPVVMEVAFGPAPYVGTEKVGASGGDIKEAPAIFFRNINKNLTAYYTGKPLIVRTKQAGKNRAVLQHVVIRRSNNIVLDNLDIVGSESLIDNALDIDDGEGIGNLEGLNQDYNKVPLPEEAKENATINVTVKNCHIEAWGRNSMHISGITGMHIENNEIYNWYDFSKVNTTTAEDVSNWNGNIKILNSSNIKYLRNKSQGTLATSLFLQGSQGILVMNNIFWNENAVTTDKNTVANVRLVSYGTEAANFPLKNIGIYYNTFFLKDNELGKNIYHNFDFFRIGGKLQIVDGDLKLNFKTETIDFDYNNCFSYDADVYANNNDPSDKERYYLQGFGESSAWCRCFKYNNFWGEGGTGLNESTFTLGAYCSDEYENYNAFINVRNESCVNEPKGPGSLVVIGDGLNIGAPVQKDVSLQGADTYYNDFMHADNGEHAVRPRVIVDNSNESLVEYDKIYKEPGTINLYTSPIVGSQTYEVLISAQDVTKNSKIKLELTDTDAGVSKAQFEINLAEMTVDANGTLNNSPVDIKFKRPAGLDDDKTYEVLLVVTSLDDNQLILRIPVRGHYIHDIRSVPGAWTVGAIQTHEPKPVNTIIWHGKYSSEWDERNNWYKEDGSLVTCLDALTEDLKVIIPATNSEQYLTPPEGITQYPVLPVMNSDADFKARGFKDGVYHGEQVNAGGENATKVASTIYLEYGASLVGVEGLEGSGASRYNEAEIDFTARRHDWLLVGTVVKPWDRDEEGNIKTENDKKLTRNMKSGDYFLNHLPHVYMHEAYITEKEGKIIADWKNSFASLEQNVPKDTAFAIRVPDQYGRGIQYIPGVSLEKLPAEVYNQLVPGNNFDGNAPHTYKFNGRFYNDNELPTYDVKRGVPTLLSNTYPASINAFKLHEEKGTTQYYDYSKKSFVPVSSDNKDKAVIMPQHSFIFTSKEVEKLNITRTYMLNSEVGHRSATQDIPSLRLALSNVSNTSASEVVVSYNEFKEDVDNLEVDAPKVFNAMETQLPDLYVMRYGKDWAGLVIPTIVEPIPLGINVSSANQTFRFSLINSTMDFDVILEDRFTEKQYNLSEGETCLVSDLAIGVCEGRFYLMLSERAVEEEPEEGGDVTTDASDIEALAGGIDIFTQNSAVVVSATSDIELQQVIISDVAGRHQVYNVSGQYIKLDLPVNTGVYTISVIGDKVTRVEKIKLN